MKAVSLGVVMAITSTLAHAEDMAEMISRYRREHGLLPPGNAIYRYLSAVFDLVMWWAAEGLSP